jgi:two-component system cell cycle sensor histidine kinase/response regulator CckA
VSSGAAMTVLVADDEPEVLSLVELLLGSLGARALPARDGREAVELFRQHRCEIDLVLLDVRMPTLDGPGACEAVRRLDPAARVWFMTGFAQGYTADDLLARGAEGVLDKPFRFEQLRAVVLRAPGGGLPR